MSRLVYGKRNVLEALEAGMRPKRILLQKGSQGDAYDKCWELGKELRVPFEQVDRKTLDQKTDKGLHQGMAALFPDFEYADLEDILEIAGPSLIIVLDHLEDPHNLGAIIRSAEVQGAVAVVIPKDRAAQITPAAEKVAAGAASRLPIARVGNIAHAIEQIKKASFWTYGLAGEADGELDKEEYPERTCLVMGQEGKGLHDRTRKICDKLVSIPQLGQVGSLNVSVAAGIAMYEVIRQRRKA